MEKRRRQVKTKKPVTISFNDRFEGRFQLKIEQKESRTIIYRKRTTAKCWQPVKNILSGQLEEISVIHSGVTHTIHLIQ